MKKILVFVLISLTSLGSFAAEFDACDILIGVDAVGGVLRSRIDNERAVSDYWRGALNQRSKTHLTIANELREKAQTIVERADDSQRIIDKADSGLRRAANALERHARYYGDGNTARYYTDKIGKMEDSGDRVSEFLVNLTREICRVQD